MKLQGIKRKFEFEFEDQSAENKITFEYDEFSEENFGVFLEDGISVMYANRDTLLALAKVFIKMALSEYSEGFHIHLRRNFDADEPEVLRVIFLTHGS